MYKHPMLSVKEAAALMGCDERWVRERLNQGQLKGEKRTIGLKDKWFVYKGEIDAALARKGVFASVSAEQPSPEPKESEQYFGVEGSVEEVETVDAQVSGDSGAPAGGASVAELVRLIASEFAEKLDQQTQLNWELRRELEDKERQLLLLPDLQKRAEEERKAAELIALELEALKKQISALEEVKESSELKLAALEEEQRTAEEAQLKVQALEKSMAERLAADEAARRAAEEELLRIKTEKEAEAKSVQEQLAALTAKLEDLQKPWWKRLFMPGGPE